MAMGLSQSEAACCTEGLMQSELRCLPGQGQGVSRLIGYYDRIAKGLYQPGAQIEILKESPALAMIDARMSMGSVVGQAAMKIAIDKAKGLRPWHEHRQKQHAFWLGRLSCRGWRWNQTASA